jgi:hypothetical protein
VLEVPVANADVGYPDSGAHAPNEHIGVEDFIKGAQPTPHVFARMRALE